MLSIFKGASAAEIRILSTELSKTLKEKHNIFLKTSKVLNLLSTVNGFKNWHTYNAHLEADSGKEISSQYESQIEDILSEPVISNIPENMSEVLDTFNSKSQLSNHVKTFMLKDDNELYFSSVSSSPKELFSYLSYVSILDKSISDSFGENLSLLDAICDTLYKHPGNNNEMITLSRLKHISSPLGLIKFTLSQSQGLEDKDSEKLYDIVKNIPGYSSDDAINESLSETYLENAKDALIDINKLIKVLEGITKLPEINISYRYHYGNKMHVIGYKINVIRFIDLDVNDSEYQSIVSKIIDSESQLKEVHEDKVYNYSDSFSFPLTSFGHKKAKCIISQKNVISDNNVTY